MAKSEKAKQNRQDQVDLADKYFEEYKEEISKCFIEEFGTSYQTVADFKDIWRKHYDYAPECEDFLKFRTRVFLRGLPIDKATFVNPHFLRILVRKICEYLSMYITKKTPERNHNDVANELFVELFDNNKYIQNKVNKFVKENNRTWGIAQKEKRKRIQQKQKIIITLKSEQKQKLEMKQLDKKIREKQIELANLEIVISAHVK